MKLLNDRVEAKVRTFYTATIVIAVIFVFSAICFAGTLARVAYWSKLSDSIGSEDSKWNTVLIIAEFVVLVFIFCNLLNIVTKGKWCTQLAQVKDFVLENRGVNHKITELSIRYMPRESGFFSRQLDYPPSFIYNRNNAIDDSNMSFEEVWSVQRTTILTTVTK